MTRIASLGIALCAFFTSCANAYEGDLRPGGIFIAAGLINPYNGNLTGRRYQRILLIAPPGASQCRIVGQSFFVAPGPLAQGLPNDKREVMLTYEVEASRATFECQTPSGVVRRSVRAVPYEITQKSYDGSPVVTVLMMVKPPLVHMSNENLAAATARWSALEAELCGSQSETTSYLCKPGLLERLKAEDLG